MAKYVTLDGLSRFLTNLKSNKFQATSDSYGAIKIGYAQTNKNYPVQLSNGQAYVNVPWVNTTYTVGTGLKNEGGAFMLNLKDYTQSSYVANSITPINSDRFYAVQLDSNAQLSVHVPWTDNSCTSVDYHYKKSGFSGKTNQALYKTTIDNAGHITAAVEVTAADIVNLGVGANNAAVVNKTYSELKTMISNSQLVPGVKYCITDYVTKVPSTINLPDGTQSSTITSAESGFNVIVKALTNNKLSEDARACGRSGGLVANFGAWELKYNIDNNVDRFAWASSSGKGVIYYMKDEFGNEAPYDFKNIKFGGAFTFISQATNNIIESCIIGTTTYLNNVKFSKSGATSNRVGKNCYNIVINGDDNVIKDNCKEIRLLGDGNNINENCVNIGSSNYFVGNYNYIGNNCSNIDTYNSYNGYTDGDYSDYNYIGNNCSNIDLGQSSSNNTIGNNCSNIEFGFSWEYNTVVDENVGVGIKFKYYTSDSESNKKTLHGVKQCIFGRNPAIIYLSNFSYNAPSDYGFAGLFDTTSKNINTSYRLQNLEFVNLGSGLLGGGDTQWSIGSDIFNLNYLSIIAKNSAGNIQHKYY